MKAMVNVRDWAVSGAIIFTVMNSVTFLKFYRAVLLIVRGKTYQIWLSVEF